MNRLQYTTMAVMSSIVGMLAVTALLLVVQSNRQKLRKKDQQLLAREELFSSLSRNVDDVFLMIDTGTGKVEYISPTSGAFWASPLKRCRRISTFYVLPGAIIADHGWTI